MRMAVAAILATVLHAASGGSTRAASEKNITLCHENQDARPWRYRNGGGLDFQLLENAARQAGVTIHYEAMSWQNCLARLQDHRVDGAFSVSFAPDHLAYGVYPGGAIQDHAKHLHQDRFVLLRRMGDRLDWDGESITHIGGALVVPSEYSIGHQLRGLSPAVEEEAENAVELVRKLSIGRIAGAVLLEGEAARILEHNRDLKARVEILPGPLLEIPYHLVFSHSFMQSSPLLAEALWRAIERNRTSAAYQLLERRTLAALGQS